MLIGLLSTTMVSDIDTSIADKVIEYTYDFGDGWSHRLRQSSVASQPRVTSRVLKGLVMESGRT